MPSLRGVDAVRIREQKGSGAFVFAVEVAIVVVSPHVAAFVSGHAHRRAREVLLHVRASAPASCCSF